MKVADMEAYVVKQIELSPLLSKLDASQMLQFAVTGLNEEAGEVAGLLCREIYKQRNISEEKWLEEMGDVLWYLIAAARAKGMTLEDLYNYNCKKLEVRYGELRQHEG